jgi:hypothetical protein
MDTLRVMRRAASILLGLLLGLGPMLSAPGHIHAAPDHEEGRGLHVDHVHLATDSDADHGHSGATIEFAHDGHGENAVALNQTGLEATPKRSSLHLTIDESLSVRPELVAVENQLRPDVQLSTLPDFAQPPGRAPPA